MPMGIAPLQPHRRSHVITPFVRDVTYQWPVMPSNIARSARASPSKSPDTGLAPGQPQGVAHTSTPFASDIAYQLPVDVEDARSERASPS